MSISTVSARAAAAFSASAPAVAAESAGSRPASAPGRSDPPVFSRGVDARHLPGLLQACQINGHIPNQSFVKEAVTGDLMRVVRDVKHGNVQDARRLLKEMSTVKLGEFFENEHIAPSLLDQLQAAVGGRADPKAMLAAVYEVLDREGASRLHGKLRPEAPV